MRGMCAQQGKGKSGFGLLNLEALPQNKLAICMVL